MIKFKEYFLQESYNVLDFSEEFGSVYGYSINTDSENLKNWLHKNNVENIEIIYNLLNKYEKIAILENINVYDEYKGRGYGNILMSNFIDGCDNEERGIILICDKSEENNFSLLKWYEGFGFEIIGNSVLGELLFLEF